MTGNERKKRIQEILDKHDLRTVLDAVDRAIDLVLQANQMATALLNEL